MTDKQPFNLFITKKNKEKLRKIADGERRTPSAQVEYWIDQAELKRDRNATKTKRAKAAEPVN